MNQTIVGKIIMKNVPESVLNGSRKGFVVARVDLTNLWYYGCYETYDRALTVASELGNGVVIEV